jgi:hypothetical protein
MKEFSQPSVINPEQAALERSFDALLWDPTTKVHELSAQVGPGFEAPLAEITPLRVEGSYALVAALKLAEEKQLNVWAQIESDGRLSTEEVAVGGINYAPAEDVSHGRRVTMPVVVNKDEFLKLGRNNEGVAQRLGLPGTVSREHLGISLTHDGLLQIGDLGSKYGTKILLKEDAKVSAAPTPNQ